MFETAEVRKKKKKDEQMLLEHQIVLKVKAVRLCDWEAGRVALRCAKCFTKH